MALLFADENYPLDTVKELRRLGHDVVTIQERGQGGKGTSDPNVLALAAAEGRAILTFNRRHFIRLHKDGTPHAGIVACTEDLDTTRLASRVHDAVTAAGDLHGQLVRVVRPPS